MKGITSPEGLIMLMVAGAFDIVGFIVFALGTWFGIDDYGILEIVGIIVFGFWMFLRYGPLGEDPFLKVKKERAKIQEEMEGLQEAEGEEESEGEEKQETPTTDKPEKNNKDTKEIPLDGEAPKKDGSKAEANSAPNKGGAVPAQGGAPTKGAKGKPLLSTKPTGRGGQSPRDIVKDEAWKLVKKALKRFGLTFLIELIPFLGGFYPGWTIFVWKEMRDDPPTMPKQEKPKARAKQAGKGGPQ